MKRAFLYTLFMCMLLTTTLLFSMTAVSTSSPSPTQLYVNPSNVEYWTPAFDKTFMINVSIANVSNLKLFAFKLYWNTTLLDLSKVDIQSFLNPPNSILLNETIEDSGRYGLAILTHGAPKNGSGALVTLSFKITYDPTWPENVTSALDLRETSLTNSTYDFIPHEALDGEYSCYSAPLLSIATTTDKPWYWLLSDSIHIHGNLTLGSSPVLDGIVALEVDNQLNQTIVIRSFPIGTPPANYTIEIVDVTPRGGHPDWNLKYKFNRGDYAHFNVTIRNNGIEHLKPLIAINIYDASLKPLATKWLELPVGAGQMAMAMFQFLIPDTAFVGNASVYAGTFTGWPRTGGTAYCPEKAATFEIEKSGGGGAASNGGEGTFDLTFKLSFDHKAGNYTIYTTSNYTIYGHTQKATNNTTFEIKVPDVNGDKMVDIVDIVVVALAFGSAEVDDPETPWDETENWNPDADLNADLRVDIVDIVIVALYFGWGVPPPT